METDADLVRDARAGDRDAFARLVEVHQSSARRVAAAMVGSGPDADDVAQDAFVKAYLRLEQFDVERSFRAWLLGIVANEARNRHRANGRRRALSLRLTSDRAPDLGTGSGPDPAVAAERDDQRQRLARAVAALDDRDREVVALRYFAELSEAETAEALGCPRGTVKSRLSRALDRLRRSLPEEVTR
jgi:RNA polymerase sigma-70 factor (ECF subfamily)